MGFIADDFIGHSFGKCRIENLIGAGGMAWVFQAYHSELGIRRAIKVLKPSEELLENSKRSLFIERFTREAKIAANLDHKNIIRIHDVGCLKAGPDTFNDDIYYIEMEFLEGITLKKFIHDHQNNINPEIIASIMYLCSDALSYAHNATIRFQDMEVKGLIHRDLKPDNIFITKEGDLKVLDLGIAKLESVSLTTSTEARNVTGTLAYMSPEQIDGKPLEKTSDIFSLGIVFYELISGRHPFLAEQASVTLVNLIDVKYEKLSESHPGINPIFNEIVIGCLKSDPKDRFQDMKEIRGRCLEVLQEQNIFHASDALKEFVLTGKIGFSKDYQTKQITMIRKTHNVLNIILVGLIILCLVLGLYVFLLKNKPKEPDQFPDNKNKENRKTLSNNFESDSFKDTTPSPIPSVLHEPSPIPAEESKIKLKDQFKSDPIKPAPLVRKKSSSSYVDSIKQSEIPSPLSPIDSARFYLSSGAIGNAIRIMLSFSNIPIDLLSKLPQADASFFYFSGLNAFSTKNYSMAASFFESAIRKSTSFTIYRISFIQNSIRYKALCYTELFKSGNLQMKQSAIKSWEGLIKITADENLKAEANSYLQGVLK